MNLGREVYDLKGRIRGRGPQGLAVDLDDCAFECSAGFIKELSKEFPPPFEITLDQAKRHYTLHGKPIYWHTLPEAVQFYTELAKSPELHGGLDLTPDAKLVLNNLDRKCLMGCYATARGEHMRKVTKDSITDNSLPRKPIIMHQTNNGFSHHTIWKAHVLMYLFPEIQGAVDNDTRIARVLEELDYQGTFFLFGPGSEEYEVKNGVVIPTRDFSHLESLALERFT